MEGVPGISWRLLHARSRVSRVAASCSTSGMIVPICVQGSGFRFRVQIYLVQGSGLWFLVQGSGFWFRVQGFDFWFRVLGFGIWFRVQGFGSGYRVLIFGSGFRVLVFGSGFRVLVQGSGFRFMVCIAFRVIAHGVDSRLMHPPRAKECCSRVQLQSPPNLRTTALQK